MRFKQDDTLFLMIDMQEKFTNVIFSMDEVINNSIILNKSSELLGLPLIITEQYPKGLGHTIDHIYIPKGTPIFEKYKFSALTAEVEKAIVDLKKSSIVIYGVETHVCLMQTAIELKSKGYKVGIVADAVSSRNIENKLFALTRLENKGIDILSTEMILFELMQDAKHESFREISKLIK